MEFLHYTNPYQKGVIHLALGAVVNALWDLWSKSLGKPLWKLVADFTPEEFVRCIDFRYITDAITPEEAIKMLQDLELTKQRRVEDALVNRAVPAYTTSAGMYFLFLQGFFGADSGGQGGLGMERTRCEHFSRKRSSRDISTSR